MQPETKHPFTNTRTNGIYFFAVIVVSSNPCVGPSPRTKGSFFLLSTCTEKLVSAPKIFVFLANLPLGNKKVIQNICTYRYQYF